MAEPKQDEVRSWLIKARQDLDGAEWLLRSPAAFYGLVGFHCQQSAEKALKAYLTWREETFEKTHSLVALVGLCMKFSPDFEDLRIAAVTLTPYAVITRYPGDLPEINVQEATDAVLLGRQVWEFVLAKLPEENHPS